MNEQLEEIKEYIIKMKRTYTAFGNDTVGEVLVCEELLKYIEYMETRDNE